MRWRRMMYLLLEILKDDRAFVEGARGRVCVQLERGNEPLRRDLEEFFRFLVWIYFICATRDVSAVKGE